MTVTYKWNGGRAPWVVRAAVADAMERWADRTVRDIRRSINIPWPPPSSPGEPPHKRTGNLRDNIGYHINRKTLVVKIGVTDLAVYGIYLEYGAPRSNLEPRPFLWRAFRNNQGQIAASMARAAKIAFNKYARHG